MLFFPENPELAFLYLYHLRLQEAEQTRLGQAVRGDQPGLNAKVRMAFENCLVRVKALSPPPHSGASADRIGKELGKLPQ